MVRVVNQPDISKGRWLCLLLISLLFLHFFVFIQLPANIYLESEVFENDQFPAIVMVLLFLGLVSLLCLTALIGLLGWPLRRVLAPTLLALAVTFWVIDSFFRRYYPALDGAISELPYDSAHWWAQILVFVAAFTALWLSQRKFELPVLIFLSVLTVLNAFWVARSLILLPQSGGHEPLALSANELFTLSSQQNVLIILMDTFQSEYLEEVLVARPGLAEDLQGFTYFPDTVGVATSTFMSMPAIHSGKAYDPSRTMSDYFDSSIRQESILTSLTNSGYQALLLNPIRHVCPENARCIERNALLRSQHQSNLGAALHLLDISLIRSLPEPLKNHVLNDGAYFVSHLFSPAAIAGDALVVWDDSRILKQYADDLQVTDRQPYATFLHLMNTHPPYVLADDCQVMASKDHDSGSRSSAIQQTTCAVSQFVELLNTLRNLGVYDQTMIVLLGDHGSSSVYADASLVSQRLHADAAIPEDAARLVGSANPLLLIKPSGAQGPMKYSTRRADLTDIPATVCADQLVCDWESGVDLLSQEPAVSRIRRFMNYRWENHFWQLGFIPELEFYTISGPVSEWGSWQLEADLLRKEIMRLEFGDADDPAHFGAGWGISEISPQGTGTRWVVDYRAELFIPLEAIDGSEVAYQLNLEVWVPEFNPNQAIAVEFNGHAIGKQSLPPGLYNLKYRVPADQVQLASNRVVLFFDQLTPSNEESQRQLAVVVRSLDFEKIKVGN